jgi:hypothetical protein
MADRMMWNVCVLNAPKPDPNEKRHWTKIGIAFEGKKPGSIRIILNAHPIGNDLFLFEKTDAPLDQRRPDPVVEVHPGESGDPVGGGDPDDEIPF